MMTVKNLKTIFAIGLGAAILSSIVTSNSFAADGKKVFRKCKACHSFTKNKVGPNLKGIVGRTAGTAEGFKYSAAMKKAGEEGLVWSADELDKFLTKPKKYMKKTKMSFSGLKKEDQRSAVIEYMASQ